MKLSLTLSAWLIAAATLGGGGNGLRAATPVASIKLPAETVTLTSSSLPGYPLASALCTICHSADYIRYQPPLSRTAWTAEVTKMQKTYGGPIPPTAIDPIADYLVRTYGTERAVPAAGAAGPAKH